MMANHHVGYVDVVPGRTGFRFQPKDQELVSFLYRKVVARDPVMAAYGVVLHECDLWGKREPWELWDEFGGDYLIDQDLYFFSPLKMVSDKRTNRKIESGGTWSGATTKDIEDSEGNVLGQRRHFRYENQKDEGDEHHGQWLLEEYSLGGTQFDQKSNPKIVLCRLKKSTKTPTKKRSNPTPQPSKKRARKEEQPQKKKTKIVVEDDQEPAHPHQSYSPCLTSSSAVCDGDQEPHPSELNNYSIDNPIMATGTGSDPTRFTHNDQDQITGLDLDDQQCSEGLSLADLERLVLKPPHSIIDADETQNPHTSGLNISLVVPYSPCLTSSSAVCNGDQEPHPSELNNYSMDNPIMATGTGSDPTRFTHDDQDQITGLDLDDLQCSAGLSLADLERLVLKPAHSIIDADETQNPHTSGLNISLVVPDDDSYSEVSGGTNHGGTDAVVAVDNTSSDAPEQQEQSLSQEQLPESQPSFALDNWSDDVFPAVGSYEDPNYLNSFLGVQLPMFGELPHLAAPLGADQYSLYQSLSDNDLSYNNLWQY